MAGMVQDSELVRLAQAGDAKAFEALVVKYQRRIARHVARYLKAAGDVEDVVQETFIRAYRGLASFRGDSAFYSWLYRIATNTALTHLERNPGEVLLGDEAPEERLDAFEPGVSDAEDPERTLFAKQIAETVQRALAKLQPELAEALMLYEVMASPTPRSPGCSASPSARCAPASSGRASSSPGAWSRCSSPSAPGGGSDDAQDFPPARQPAHAR